LEKSDFKSVLLCKTESWSYEFEYRIIFDKKFYYLKDASFRVILGAKIDKTHEEILRKAIGDQIEVIKARIDSYQGCVAYE